LNGVSVHIWLRGGRCGGETLRRTPAGGLGVEARHKLVGVVAARGQQHLQRHHLGRVLVAHAVVLVGVGRLVAVGKVLLEADHRLHQVVEVGAAGLGRKHGAPDVVPCGGLRRGARGRAAHQVALDDLVHAHEFADGRRKLLLVALRQVLVVAVDAGKLGDEVQHAGKGRDDLDALGQRRAGDLGALGRRRRRAAGHLRRVRGGEGCGGGVCVRGRDAAGVGASESGSHAIESIRVESAAHLLLHEADDGRGAVARCRDAGRRWLAGGEGALRAGGEGRCGVMGGKRWTSIGSGV
jgi:hypothetical protein